MLKSDWALNHVGLVVRDYDQPLGYYQSTRMGVSVGPQIVDLDFRDASTGEPGNFYMNEDLGRLNGGSGPGQPLAPESPRPEGARRGTYRFMDKDLQVGTLLLELLRDRSIPFEGITHLAYNVPDVDAETALLQEKGCEIILAFTEGKKVNENYLDTREYGHLIISFRPPVGPREKAWWKANLSHPMVSDWEYYGIGLTVRDLDQTVAYYDMLGIAEFAEERWMEAVGDPNDTRVKARTRVGMLGAVACEFIQPTEGEALHGESLASRGEGVSELTFRVNDLDAETAQLKANGVELALRGQNAGGPSFACFDTRQASGNLMIRLVQK